MLKSALFRNAFHFSGIIIPATYLFAGRTFALATSLVLLFLSGIAELLRLKGFVKAAAVKAYLKPKESRKPSGSFFYLLAASVVVVLFNRDAAIASLLILSIADPAASIVGRRFGRRRPAGKSLAGTLAFFCTALIILLFFPFSVPARIAGACVASLTELLTPPIIDDNLSVPVVTALFLQATLFLGPATF